MGWFIKTPELGAQTTIYCAVEEALANESGCYYADCEKTRPSCRADDKEVASKLWDASLELVGLQKEYNPFKKELL